MANPITTAATLPRGGVIPAFTLGDRLRKARESAGLEMGDLAADIGIHRQSVARYERGDSVPKRPIIVSWSMITGVDAAWILSGTESTHDEQTTRTTVFVSVPENPRDHAVLSWENA